MKTLAESVVHLVDICFEWNNDAEQFAQIVADYLRLAKGSERTLAAEFDVAATTVSRWVSGVACPHPLIQKKIVEAIGRHASEIAARDN